MREKEGKRERKREREREREKEREKRYQVFHLRRQRLFGVM